MSNTFDIAELVETSRATAAAAHADMRILNKALNGIVSAGPGGLFALWDAIDEQIGKAKAPGLRDRLIDLRTRFIDHTVAREINRVEETLKRSPDEGWNAWLLIVADSISYFRKSLAITLCEYRFPFQGREAAATELAKTVRRISQDRWPETYDQIETLSGKEFLSPTTRARLLVILAEIHLYHFRKSGPAWELFNAAKAIVPRDVRVVSALGDYWVRKKGLETGQSDSKTAKSYLKTAESYYQRAMKIARKVCYGYVGMGDASENKNDLKAAERWYRKAIASASGDSLGYERLIRLYGQPGLFEKHEADLLSLTKVAIALTPDAEYRRYIAVGDIYTKNRVFEKAEPWFRKAIALDRTNPEGYVSIGLWYEKLGTRDEAETAYKRAIEVAPESIDAYWALTGLYEQQNRWQDALEWYKKAPLYRKEWAGVARAKIGEMQYKLGNHREAEDILKQELRADKDNQIASEVLQTIAKEHYSKRDDRNAAVRLYAEILGILGDSYQGDHHNRLGNLNYHYGENEEAAAEYRRAIAATPDNAVFHRNLATAHTALKQYQRAAQEVRKARRIDRDTDKFNSEMALLANAEGNDYFTKGDYRKALALYTKAVAHDPEDDVLHANRARAWEQIKEPVKRTEALDKAIEAYKTAHSLNPTDEYVQSIRRLRRRKELVSSYGEKSIDWVHVVTPIAIEVAGDLIPHIEGSTQGSLADALSKHVAEMRQRVEDLFGVKIPGLRFRGNKADLLDGTYIIMLMEIPVVSGNVALDRRFFAGSAQALSAAGITGEEVVNPLTGDDGFWIARQDWQRAEAATLDLWDVMKYPVMHLEAVLRRNLAEFVGHEEVARRLEVASPRKLEELRARSGKHTALTSVCRALVAEEVAIRQFDAIYETFDHDWSEHADLQGIVEGIRALPAIGAELPGNGREYTVLPLGPRYQTEIRRSIYRSDSHAVLAMEPENCQQALTALREETGSDRHLALMVPDPELRPFVRRLIELEFPNIPVLSQRELRGDSRVVTTRPVELHEEAGPAEPIGTCGARVDGSAVALEDEAIDDAPGNSRIDVSVFVSGAFGAKSVGDDQPIESMLSQMRDGLFSELGILVPEVRLKVDRKLKGVEIRFRINGRGYPPVRGLGPDEFLVNDTVDRLTLLNIHGREATNPANGSKCAIVREASAALKTCREAGLTTWGPAGFLVLALSATVRKNAAAFQTVDVTKHILESLQTAFPELIETTLKRFTVDQLCLVLRSLLDEDISIRDMRTILESMLAVNGATDVDLSRYIVFTPYAEQLCLVPRGATLPSLTASDYSNFVRASLKRYISHKYTRGGNTLVVYLLDLDIERRIGEAGARPLDDGENDQLKRAVREELGRLPPTAQNPVLLTTTDIRRPLRKLLEADFPNLAVVSYQELSPDLNIQPIARISWGK